MWSCSQGPPTSLSRARWIQSISLCPHSLISIFDSEQYHLSFTAECCEGHHDNTTDLWWCSSQSGSIPVTSLVDAVLILTQKTRQLKGSWWILQCYRKVVMRIRGLLSGDFGLQSLCGDCQNQRVRLILLLMVLYGQDSSVGIATHHGLDGPGIESQWDFLHPSRPALGPTQPPIQWVPGLSQGVKRPSPSSAEVKERVQLYLYSSSGLSGPVVGWILL